MEAPRSAIEIPTTVVQKLEGFSLMLNTRRNAACIDLLVSFCVGGF